MAKAAKAATAEWVPPCWWLAECFDDAETSGKLAVTDQHHVNEVGERKAALQSVAHFATEESDGIRAAARVDDTVESN